MNLFLFIAWILIFTLIWWKIIERIRIPWVFSALFLWLILSIYNPFTTITSSETFQFMSDLWMYFLLFIIWLELDIKEMFKQWKFIPALSMSLFLWESIVWSIFIHWIFHLSWGISILVASSFATVWEAILIPILDEFKIIKTKFGQTILWIWTIDDIVELATIVAVSVLLWESIWWNNFSLWTISLIIAWLFLVPILLQVFKSKLHQFKFKQVPTLFLFWLIVLFIFIWTGYFVESAALWAIFAWIALKNLMPRDRTEKFEWIIRTIAYGLLVPIFFLSVWSEVNLNYLITAPWLILSVLAITIITKIIISYFWSRKKLWTKKSILLWIWLSAKFSTSIVILTMMFEKSLISSELFSVLIWAMIVSQFIIPVSLSMFLKKWKLKFTKI